MEDDNKKSSDPTQGTDDNEEAIMREQTGGFMAQDQCKCNDAKNLKGTNTCTDLLNFTILPLDSRFPRRSHGLTISYENLKVNGFTS